MEFAVVAVGRQDSIRTLRGVTFFVAPLRRRLLMALYRDIAVLLFSSEVCGSAGMGMSRTR